MSFGVRKKQLACGRPNGNLGYGAERFRRDIASYRKVHWQGQPTDYLDTLISGKYISVYTIEVAVVWALTSRFSPQFRSKTPVPLLRALDGPQAQLRLVVWRTGRWDKR